MDSGAELNKLTQCMRTYKALPKIPSDPERSSSDTSAPTRDTQKDGVRVAVEVVPMSVFDCECNCKVAKLQVTV